MRIVNPRGKLQASFTIFASGDDEEGTDCSILTLVDGSIGLVSAEWSVFAETPVKLCRRIEYRYWFDRKLVLKILNQLSDQEIEHPERALAFTLFCRLDFQGVINGPYIVALFLTAKLSALTSIEEAHPYLESFCEQLDVTPLAWKETTTRQASNEKEILWPC